MQETWIWSLDWEDPQEKELATHSSILAWRIPWSEEPGGIDSTRWKRVRHDWETNTKHNTKLDKSEWYFSKREVKNSLKVKLSSLSRVQLFATPWAVAYQAPPTMGFSRQEYLSGLPFPSPGHLPDPGIKPRSPTLQADALSSEPPGKPLVLMIIQLSS